MTEGTEETITDPEEVPAKRSRRGAPRKPRVPRKKPPPAYIQLSPALQSELRKLQHAAARGSSASAAEMGMNLKSCRQGSRVASS